jgi:hypothetical protein
MSRGGDMLELGVILALERIGDRDWRYRDAGGMAGEREERVVDAVGGEDHHRPLGRETALDETRRQGIDNRSSRRIGQFAPEVAVTLRQEYAGGTALHRRTEKPRQARIMRGHGLGGAIAQNTVAAALANNARGRISNRAQRHRCGHSETSAPGLGAFEEAPP